MDNFKEAEQARLIAVADAIGSGKVATRGWHTNTLKTGANIANGEDVTGVLEVQKWSKSEDSTITYWEMNLSSNDGTRHYLLSGMDNAEVNATLARLHTYAEERMQQARLPLPTEWAAIRCMATRRLSVVLARMSQLRLRHPLAGAWLLLSAAAPPGRWNRSRANPAAHHR